MDTHADDELTTRFVGTFCQLDGAQLFTHSDPPPDELNAGIDPNDWDRVLWRPAQVCVGAEALKDFYYRLQTKLPPLYERLIASWRWVEVFLYRIRLLANPPGKDLAGLADNILRDPAFVKHLVRNGFVPFGFDSGDNSDLHDYNPVCFDTNHCNGEGDCPIVTFEHEAMLSFDRIGDSWIRWDSFRQLVIETIEFANSRPDIRST
jgi:hypothetical protein